LTIGISGRAVAEDRLVVSNDYQNEGLSLKAFVDDGITAAMAAPVHENGEVVGSLLIATRTEGHEYGPEQQEVLLAFAEHASLALTDARTLEQMNDARHD